MVPIFLDFETYWSVTHSLTKMNPIAYVMHPDTEIISVSIKDSKAPARVVFGEANVKAALKAIDWSDKLAVAHNMSGFDAMICAWRCGIKPAMWGCTLAMARPKHGLDVGGSLAKLVEHYKLGVKDSTVLLNTKGRHLVDFTPQEIEEMRIYNAMDTEQCSQLFYLLLPGVPNSEMKIIDMTVRMLVEPQFVVDKELLITTLAEEKRRKHDALVELTAKIDMEENPAYAGIRGSENEAVLAEVISALVGKPTIELQDGLRKILASAPKFAARLMAWGVTPPTKRSPTDPTKRTWAFAKTDEAYIALQDHPNPLVAAATQLRLDIKSTILESRIESFLEVADATGGKMPIAKNYYAAHTGRWGGSMGLNQENLPRVNPEDPKPSDALRRSLRAPKGCKVVVADLSGIELRVNMFLWMVPYAMTLFKADPRADLYKPLAAEVLGVPVEGMTKMQRQSGKAMHLGCGFGLGSPEKYIAVARQMAQLEVMGSDALEHIRGYRERHPEVVAGWKKCHESLSSIHGGWPMVIDAWGMCRTSREGIHTPVGMIRYPGLHQEENTERAGMLDWWYGSSRNRSRIYAGKVTENIVQHLARFVLAGNALAVKKVTGYWPKHTVHDELIYLVPDSEADGMLAEVHKAMRTPPAWWPELVTWSEGGIGDTYGDVEK